MAYEIRKDRNHMYNIVNTNKQLVIKEGIELDEANIFCWQNKDPKKRYQILANSWARSHELTWYEIVDDLIIPNGYSTIEEARLAIVEDLQEYCYNNECETHPNPFDDYSIIETFTGEEIDYDISVEEASHPDPDFKAEEE